MYMDAYARAYLFVPIVVCNSSNCQLPKWREGRSQSQQNFSNTYTHTSIHKLTKQTKEIKTKQYKKKKLKRNETKNKKKNSNC